MGYKVVTSGAFVASQSVNNNKVSLLMDYLQSILLNQKQLDNFLAQQNNYSNF